MSTAVSVPVKMNPQEVAARRHDEELTILDVRNKEDVEEWPLEADLHLPIYDDLLDENFTPLRENLDELPQDQELAVICVAGITSSRAATFLREQGYPARSVSDGMEGWGRVHRTFEVDGADGITQIIRPGTGCISYLVRDRTESLVIDPSQYVDRYLQLADEHDVDIVGVIDTHAHADHISGSRQLRDTLNIPYFVPEADSGALENFLPLHDGETVAVGTRELEVVATPGHTPGSVSLRTDGALLSGDTLFVEGVGRPDLADADETAVRESTRDLFQSLDRLADLPDDTLVLPGHFTDQDGRPLTTTIYGAKWSNDLFGMDDESAFVDTIVDTLSDTPANHEEIKQINQGEAPIPDDAADLELGPNNCAAE